jgi:hypothetical protein
MRTVHLSLLMTYILTKMLVDIATYCRERDAELEISFDNPDK